MQWTSEDIRRYNTGGVKSFFSNRLIYPTDAGFLGSHLVARVVLVGSTTTSQATNS